MEKFHKNKKDKNKEKKKHIDSDDEGQQKKRKRNRTRDRDRNKFKKNKDNNNANNDNNEENKSKGKLKFHIDEKGRKRYDFSGTNAHESKKDSNNLSLNEEKKKLIFPPADERTFLKPRDESEIVDVEKIKGMILTASKQDSTLNAKNKKEMDEKVSALGVFVPAENKDAHRGDVFYCKTCDCVLKDNAAYIEHLNGKKRN